MDNLGDWLYIILLVVAGISGLFSSGKKKKRPTQVLGQPGMEDRVPEEVRTEQGASTPGKGFWQMLEEMAQEQKQVPAAPKKARQGNVTREKRAREKERISKPRYETLGSGSFDQNRYSPLTESYTSTIESSFKDNPAEEQPEVTSDSFGNIEEVRKAIIYAEILNRKY